MSRLKFTSPEGNMAFVEFLQLDAISKDADGNFVFHCYKVVYQAGNVPSKVPEIVTVQEDFETILQSIEKFEEQNQSISLSKQKMMLRRAETLSKE